MAKNLVIVESPAKAKTINKLLGKDYVVLASMGHVRDLPEKKFGVNVKDNFEPEYVLVKGRNKIIQELKKAAKSAQSVYLAPDPDREGEAIAWHLKEILKNTIPEDQFFRVVYHEITETAIRQAFQSPGLIDSNKVDAQQARRILDRLVGYQVSPLLWRRVPGAASAGRVQSVALRLVCEREREILDFEPVEYWLLGATVQKQVTPQDPFTLRLSKIDGKKAEIASTEQARQIKDDLSRRKLVVASVKEREIKKNARPPYITSTLQQAASSLFSYSPSRTMKIAQKLYEGMDLGDGEVGLITYMRTDSVNISQQAQQECRFWIEEQLGDEYLPAKPARYRSKSGAQEAHEAIRPTNVNYTPEKLQKFLTKEEWNLYRIIWQRFVASQMAPARIAQRTVEVDAVADQAGATPYLFRASVSEVVFPGYMQISGAEKKSAENGSDNDEIQALPPLSSGEELRLMEWLSEQKFTQPPARFSEASLIKALEENGVGRPSTYAQIISTLTRRKYADREKRNLKPTPLGFRVNDFLVSNLDKLFDVTFTAQMEGQLDDIEQGQADRNKMLSTFHQSMTGWLDSAKGPAADRDELHQILDLLVRVEQWDPPVSNGRRVFSDQKFVKSIQRQAAKEGTRISQRQMDVLKKLAAKYNDQVPELASFAPPAETTGEAGKSDASGPKPETLEKLSLLNAVTFLEPYQVGKRTFDDQAFFLSLKSQAENGRDLSANQVNYLDKLIMKYAEQIKCFEETATRLGIGTSADRTEDPALKTMLELLAGVSHWKEPVQKGKRVWDDQEFYQSLSKQFSQKKTLSPKQTSALKRLVKKYADQIPDFETVKEELNL